MIKHLKPRSKWEIKKYKFFNSLKSNDFTLLIILITIGMTSFVTAIIWELLTNS